MRITVRHPRLVNYLRWLFRCLTAALVVILINFALDCKGKTSSGPDKRLPRQPAASVKEHGARPFGFANSADSNIPDDILSMSPPRYLSNYKNPCWYERRAEKKKLRCLPYFYLVGVDKCGTTDLFFRLLAHPNILRTKAVNSKETHWWSWRRFGYDVFISNQRILHFEDYLRFFDNAAVKLEALEKTSPKHAYLQQIVGDGSPTAFWDLTGWPYIPQNRAGKNVQEPTFTTPHCIRHLTPQAKFILSVRNPTKRLYSDYLFLMNISDQKNQSPEDFHSRVLDSLKYHDKCRESHSLRACLYNRTLHMKMRIRLFVGMYSVYLKEWLSVFPPDQFFILRMEDYSKNMSGYLKQIFNFLQLDELKDDVLTKITSGNHYFARSAKDKQLGMMLPQTKALLDNFYKSYNSELAMLLKDKRFHWSED